MWKSVVENIANYAVSRTQTVALKDKFGKVTYGELWSKICKCRQVLQSYGIEKGCNVTVKSAQCIDHFVIRYALQLLGAVICAAEKSTPKMALIEMADRLNSKYIISDVDFSDCCTGEYTYIDVNMIKTQLCEMEVEEQDISFPTQDDISDILFTTGTTGSSKGVVITQGAFSECVLKLSKAVEHDSDNMLILTAPLNHAKGVWHSSVALNSGGSCHVLDGLIDFKAFFDALDNSEKRLELCMSPSGLRNIMILAKNKLGSYGDKIYSIQCGSAPLSEEDKVNSSLLLPNAKLFNIYGASESGITIVYDYNKHKGKKACVGLPTSGTEVFVVDDKRNVITSSADNLGTLAFKTNAVMKQYYNEPELTKSVIQDKTVYTNDIGYIDEDGFVYICGRRDDVINIGGLKIAPLEVEDVALQFKGVRDCICICEENPILGKYLKLLVVISDDAKLDSAEIMAFMSARLEKYKVPNRYEKVDEIARTYNGKLNRKAYQ